MAKKRKPHKHATSPPEVRAASREPRKEYGALEGWRGLCACMVALYHFRAVIGFPVNSHLATWSLVRNAYLFVDFFFVLSGFIIAARYQATLASGTVRLRQFLLLRIGRLYPLHVFTLGVMVLMLAFYRFVPHPWIIISMSPNDASPYSLFTNLLLLQGLHANPILTWNHPSWSISAEFATYVIFSLIWKTARTAWWIGAAAIVVAAPLLLLKLKGNMDVTFDWAILRSLLGFALGAAVFSGSQRPSVRAAFARLGRGSATVLELACAAGVVVFVMLAGLTSVSIAAPFVFAITVLVFSAGAGLLSTILASAAGLTLGRLSYSIYMLHYPLQQLLMLFAVWLGATKGLATTLFLFPANARPMLGASAWAGDAINAGMLCILIGASAITYRWIESPWRARFRRLAARA